MHGYPNNSDDTLDIRNVIERFEELEGDRVNYVLGAPDGTETPAPELWAENEPEDAAEHAALKSLLDDLKGYGGDHQWEGSWYPVVLVRDDHFREYAEELAEELHGDAIRKASWPMNCINWEDAAKELKVDYSTVEFDGVTYWYR